jgi:hypothetical protein
MNNTNMAEEMKKIEGYPILIDGKYFAIRPNQETEQEEEVEVTSPKKMFGGFAKKLLNKKSGTKTLEPSFSYYIEVKEYKSVSQKDKEFNAPSNYKKK